MKNRKTYVGLKKVGIALIVTLLGGILIGAEVENALDILKRP